jgi:hypothetical protein
LRKIVVLLVLVVLVVGAWTGGWFYLRDRVLSEMDRALADLASKGAEITCPDRSATGWPFRLEVACANPVAAFAGGGRVSAPAFAVVWHVVDPKLVVASAVAPLVVEGHGDRATLTFDAMRASLRTEDMRSGTLAVETTKPGLTVTGPDGATAAEGAADIAELHLRPTPGVAGAWDVAASARALTGTNGGAPLLPAPADAGIDVSVSELRRLGDSPAAIADWAAAGGTFTLREATLLVGDTKITAAGTATLGTDGRPSGTLDASATRIDWLTRQAQDGRPLPPALAALGTAFLLLGRPMEGEGTPRGLTVAIDDGTVTANGLSIGEIPSLFPPGP